MDSWEFNKIAGAILAALLVVFGGKTLLEVGQGGHGSHEAKAGYTLPVQVADNSNSAGAAGSAPAGFEVAAVLSAT